MRWTLITALALIASPAAAEHTRQYWSDGKAELSGYTLDQPRYGQMRKGTVALVFVKEVLWDASRVKAGPRRKAAGKDKLFDVLKLNLVKDFQTGIYDYNLMTTVFATFVAQDGHRAGAPSKVTYSHQEWCGSLFDEVILRADGLHRVRHTYFDDDELPNDRIEFVKDGLLIDELPFVVRSFPTATLRPGESRKIHVLTAFERARLLHVPQRWMQATLHRSNGWHAITVPAGKFEVELWTLQIDGEEGYAYRVERAFPHRIIEWRGPQGERAQLLGNTRLAYWELNDNGGEKYLRSIGFGVPAAAADPR